MIDTAHAYLYASVFDEYTFSPPENWQELAHQDWEESEVDDEQPYICFEINVSTMVQCLSLFESRMNRGDTHANDARRRGEYVEVSYLDVGEPLCLGLHTGRLDMKFRLRTLDSSLAPGLHFAPEATLAQVIMKVCYFC